MLEARDLVKSYGANRAVGGVSFRVDPGRIVGLVGNNGAGKTTTLKMLTGLLEPTSGQALLDGEPTLDAPVRARVGYLPEESAVYDDDTPNAYLAFFAELYGLPRRDARDRAQGLLERLRLGPDHWKRPLGTLSKGMRRKVAIARTLLHDPAVLILDESTSGLDPATDRELTRFFRDLRDQGKAVLLSAHNLPQVEELCDEILLMHDGRIAARGTLHELRRRWGQGYYRVRATVPFPGSRPDGPQHVAHLADLPQVETALDAIRRGEGTVLHVESVPPRLDEILQQASAEGGPASGVPAPAGR